jgi:phage/plasmid-associated DNA primase
MTRKLGKHATISDPINLGNLGTDDGDTSTNSVPKPMKISNSSPSDIEKDETLDPFVNAIRNNRKSRIEAAEKEWKRMKDVLPPYMAQLEQFALYYTYKTVDKHDKEITHKLTVRPAQKGKNTVLSSFSPKQYNTKLSNFEDIGKHFINPPPFDDGKNKSIEGFGIVMRKESGLVCIDLDRVLDKDKDEPWEEMAPIIEKILNIDGWTERSVSGRGLHIFVKCDDIENVVKYKNSFKDSSDPDRKLEIYTTHWIALTGKIYKGHDTLRTVSAEQINAIVAEFGKPKLESGEKKKSQQIADLTPIEFSNSDEIVLRYCKVDSLFLRISEDMEDVRGNMSHTIFSMCRIVSFFTRDPEQIYRIVNNTPLILAIRAHTVKYDRDLDIIVGDVTWLQHQIKTALESTEDMLPLISSSIYGKHTEDARIFKELAGDRYIYEQNENVFFGADEKNIWKEIGDTLYQPVLDVLTHVYRLYHDNIVKMREEDPTNPRLIQEHSAIQKRMFAITDERYLSSICRVLQESNYIGKSSYRMNNDVGKLAAKNGLIDLRTKKVDPIKPEDYVFACADVEYKPSLGQSKEFIQFIEQMMGDHMRVDKSRSQWFLSYLGYMITGTAKEKKILSFKGDGDNGKTTLFTIVRKLLGETVCTDVSESLISADTFSSSHRRDIKTLRGIRVAYIKDYEGKISPSKFQQLTDPYIKYAAPYSRGETTLPVTFALAILTNHELDISSASNASYGRSIIVELESQWFDPNDKDRYDKENPYHFERDINYVEKMVEKEGQKIFNTLVDYAHKYMNEGIVYPDDVLSLAKQKQDQFNFLLDFVKTELEFVEGSFVYNKALAHKYNEYVIALSQEGEKLSFRAFSQAVEKIFARPEFKKYNIKKALKDRNGVGWTGVKFKSIFNSAPSDAASSAVMKELSKYKN